ncbi:MAG: hypothetical protein Q8W51_00530 [Candidatus Palauibacterales bacterium]|nr:hypothetical protein [Candidatus Palauibacterales bacterium]MDP2528204.1 hypothetical protein [Candidatus Palauibacterales bacterium]MDP2584864.1 hypothetical protein [Candidatus Palauibacterales bacterium]
MIPPSDVRDRAEPGTLGAEHDHQPCASCRELYPHNDLDRQLWCPSCREDLGRRVRWGRHAAALLVTLPFAVWILLEGRSGVLPMWAWLLPLGAAYYLGYRIGREVMRGYVRVKRGGASDPD